MSEKLKAAFQRLPASVRAGLGMPTFLVREVRRVLDDADKRLEEHRTAQRRSAVHNK